jgi:hypothetical protein
MDFPAVSIRKVTLPWKAIVGIELKLRREKTWTAQGTCCNLASNLLNAQKDWFPYWVVFVF